MLTEQHRELVREVAGHLHAGQRFDAAKVILRFSGIKKEPKTQTDAMEPLQALLAGLLNMDEYELGASMLWTPQQFDTRPIFTQRIWKAIREERTIFLMGAASTTKSYSAGAWCLLDWIRDPEFTSIKLVGPSEVHLKDNLFSHILALHQNASIPLPGKAGDLFLGFRKNRRASIAGVVIPLGKKGAGKIQGTKRFPRKNAHPQFGPLSRLRVLLDEIEKVPEGIFSDLDNVFANVEGTHGLKVIGAFNPEIVGGPVYQRAEPPQGWPDFDVDRDFEWVSKRGWKVIRLDAKQCENITEGRIIYPGLQTKEGFESLIQLSGGTSSPGYFTFGRAAYPPQGTSYSIIPGTFLNDFRGSYIFLDKPRLCAAVDSALEGGDPATVAIGYWGLATGVERSTGATMFKDSSGVVRPRWGLQIDRIFNLEKGDTVAVARQVKNLVQTLRLDPNWLMLDRTGNGAGVHDYLKDTLSPEVRAVNYSESATHTKIMAEDTEYCDEAYERIYTELLFALRSWIEFGVLRLSPLVESEKAEKLIQQMTSRSFRTVGPRRKAESKQDFKARSGGHSPNECDAVSLLVHGVRVASGVSPSLGRADNFDAVAEDNEDLPFRIGVTDRFESLDSEPNDYFSIGRSEDI